jgi:hypothetical protein
MIVGIVGLVSPDNLTTVRRLYFATPASLYAAAAARVAMGLVLIRFAPASRAPNVLRALGTIVCAQGLAAALLGVDRARAILEWEAIHTLLARIGAIVALGTGSFIAFTLTLSAAHESDGCDKIDDK